MATSQNGWVVHTSSDALASLDWITGRVRSGDVHAIFDDLCAHFHREVEPIIRSHSWGWAYRAIRGSTSGYSNHASGTAVDLNAPAHPIGSHNTFSYAKQTRIRAILRRYDGAIRWGGDYSGRPDDMHFEIDTTAADLARVVRSLQEEPDMTPAQAKELQSAAEDAAWTRKRIQLFIKNEVTRDQWRNKQVRALRRLVARRTADTVTTDDLEQIAARLDELAADLEQEAAE